MSSSDDSSFLTLVQVTDKESPPTWDDFSEDPQLLLDYIKRYFAVSPTKINEIQNVYVGPERPEVDTIWFNTIGVPFIGIPVNGEFFKIYQYAPGAIVAYTGANLPTGTRELGPSELTSYGLPTLTGPARWITTTYS